MDVDQARAVAAQYFGVEGVVEELGSNQDRNFRIDSPRGRFLLKIANPAFSDLELDAQDQALVRLAEAVPDMRVPRPKLSRDGEYIARFGADGAVLRARLLSFVPGFSLFDSRYLAPVVVGRLGAMAGQVVAGLADFQHPGLERVSQWDLRNARRVCEALGGFMADAGRAEVVRGAVEAACDRLDALSPELRVQAIHGDVTDDNVVCERERNGRPVPTGLIDFGDLGSGWIVGELATTCAAILLHSPERPLALLPAVRAFHQIVPLTDAEIAALWPAIVARTGVLVVSGEHQELIDPDNEYAIQRMDNEWQSFEAAMSLPAEVAHSAFRAALTKKSPKRTAPRGSLLLPGIPESDAAIVDLTAQSETLRDGTWLNPDAEIQIARRSTTTIFRYGEARLTRTSIHSDHAPESVSLGVEIFCPPGTPVAAPFDGVLCSVTGSVVLAGDDADLHLQGISSSRDPGERVKAGDLLGEVASHSEAQAQGPQRPDDLLGEVASHSEAQAQGPQRPGDLLGEFAPHREAQTRELRGRDDLLGLSAGDSMGRLFVQLCTLRDSTPPAFVAAEMAVAWGSVCPDPSPLIGLDCAVPAEPTSGDVLELRRKAFAEVQENYYEDPPRIERGWRQHLSDLDGRTYLDMVNNVAAVGHAHPRLNAAVSRQWNLLNTNSRFNYRAVADFSKRLADLLPDPLDTVFLVNSGSEAVDLALRLAQTFTQRQDIVSVAEAYHGWTIGSDAVSTSMADNPNALTTRPSWVHPVFAPNMFRGQFRGPDAGARYVENAVQVIETAVASGQPPAAFICEAFYGNAGGVPLPDGYLQDVYTAVRAAGGLCIADEVQVGYGRLGHHFWGFEQQRVTPDIVTVAKAMGNGHPLGAVITRRDIAEAFSRNGYFFSSAGGSPVSCAVGMTVLDIIADEALQQNAATIGTHLRTRLEALAHDHPIIGAVHGMGLYMGVELVRNQSTLEPAPDETAAICERLLDLGVIVQPTGDHLNVLKIKPPMCLTPESANFFIDTLTRTLHDGW
ncbi:aminotransferase family protein [Acrocarpospora macrocephala]|uniref:aminotransferase family protein n=1 Tax=Acrocarpospora macrocephala TaxID=150177 RepID=UPI0014797C70|nr:aminotransferase family protein [Acrocarpospora macrocephala]